MYSDHQFLLFISLSLYALELLLYSAVRELLKRVDEDSGLTDEIKSLVGRVQGKEIMFFTGIYVSLLFVAKFYMWVFFLVLGLQSISLLVDIMLVISLWQQKR